MSVEKKEALTRKWEKANMANMEMLHSFVIRAITDGNWNFLLFCCFLFFVQVSLGKRFEHGRGLLCYKNVKIFISIVVNTVYKTLNGVKIYILCNRRLSGGEQCCYRFNRVLIQFSEMFRNVVVIPWKFDFVDFLLKGMHRKLNPF